MNWVERVPHCSVVFSFCDVYLPGCYQLSLTFQSDHLPLPVKIFLMVQFSVKVFSISSNFSFCLALFVCPILANAIWFWLNSMQILRTFQWEVSLLGVYTLHVHMYGSSVLLVRREILLIYTCTQDPLRYTVS